MSRVKTMSTRGKGGFGFAFEWVQWQSWRKVKERSGLARALGWEGGIMQKVSL